MPWGAAIAAVAAIGGSMMQSNAAEDAADAQSDAADRGVAEQRRQFDLLQQNNAPYLQAGSNALNGLSALMAGDYSAFENSPDYLYARQQMQQGLDHSAAARGRLYSGGYGVDMAQHLGGLASQNLGGYRGFLQQMANLGQNSANMQGQAGMNMANSIGGLYGMAGNAAASGALASGNAWANGLNQLSQAANTYFGQQRNSSYGGNSGGGGAWADGSPYGGSWGGMDWNNVGGG